MDAFGTLIGQYNATLLTLDDKQHSIAALDVKSRIILDHTTSSTKIGDGTNILDILVEDAASSGGEKGIMPLGIRKDTLSSFGDTDGDFVPFAFDENGRLYVTMKGSRGEHKEDDAHSSGDYGMLPLAVRKDAEGSLVDTDGDYAPLQVDLLGRLRVVAELDLTPGTIKDEGADEEGDGEVGSIGATFVDLVSIDVAAGKTLNICEVDGCSDKLCSFQLVVDDDGTIIKYIRKFLTPENVASHSIVFPRAIPVTGGAIISVKLQAKRLRGGSENANAAGGINAYEL